MLLERDPTATQWLTKPTTLTTLRTLRDPVTLGTGQTPPKVKETPGNNRKEVAKAKANLTTHRKVLVVQTGSPRASLKEATTTGI